MEKSEDLKDILFYSLENAIKAYRQYAQRVITENGFNITIDQWLVLKTILENPGQTQHRIAEMLFKDHASLTRIIDSLVGKNYLIRGNHDSDRRRFKITVTEQAMTLLKNIQPLIERNRSVALAGISTAQSNEIRHTLATIINNCTTN